jgi:SAM-dependent methyltransferase
MSVVELGLCRNAAWGAFARKAVLPWALQGFSPVGDVLEIGGGNGAMADGMIRTHPNMRLTMTDIDPAMAATARRRLAAHPPVSVEEADATELPFADSSFDTVASYLMLHHVVDWRNAILEVARVLRPGGTFVGYDLDATRATRLFHVLDRSPHRLIPRRQFSTALQEGGFEPVNVTTTIAGQAFRFLARKDATRTR